MSVIVARVPRNHANLTVSVRLRRLIHAALFVLRSCTSGIDVRRSRAVLPRSSGSPTRMFYRRNHFIARVEDDVAQIVELAQTCPGVSDGTHPHHVL